MLSQFLILGLVVAATTEAATDVPLRRHRSAGQKRSIDAVLRAQAHIKAKYGVASPPTSRKRAGATAGVALGNLGADSSYFAEIAVGTPPQTLNVILDTGSSDLWLAGASCLSCEVSPFDDTASTTFAKSVGAPAFNITYGSGKVLGVTGTDTVSFAGITQAQQVLSLATDVEATEGTQLLNAPQSGLMGLAFESLAVTNAKPFWQNVAAQLAQPMMSFSILRSDDLSAGDDVAVADGGVFTLGGTNSSLFTGDIDFVNLAGTPMYWSLPLKTLTVDGQSVPLPAAQTVAIDTGTSLMVGPPAVAAQIYSRLPGGHEGRGSLEGVWLYDCANHDADIEVSFGGQQTWKISPEDFAVAEVGEGFCVGALLALDLQTPGLTWIFGDTFLKGVYSVFRFGSPPAVGFAALAVPETQTGFRSIPGSNQIPASDIGAASSVRAPLMALATVFLSMLLL